MVKLLTPICYNVWSMCRIANRNYSLHSVSTEQWENIPSGPSLWMDLTGNRSFDDEGRQVYYGRPPVYTKLKKNHRPQETDKPSPVCKEIKKGKKGQLILLPIHKKKNQWFDQTHQHFVGKNIQVIWVPANGHRTYLGKYLRFIWALTAGHRAHLKIHERRIRLNI